MAGSQAVTSTQDLKAPARIAAGRVVLRRATAVDAEAIYHRYASDPEVTRFLSWPRHTAVEQTHQFIAFSDAEWERWPAGPYLLETAHGELIGGCGLAFETRYRASTGYVLARDAWGQGYATEALRLLVLTARSTGLRRLYALCHAGHRASGRVLEKCGFAREGLLRSFAEFPNLHAGTLEDVLCYAMIFE
jgi:[ribosomal protein S5]-alanine N-acetyltransferase